jgi:hypothetical protein
MPTTHLLSDSAHIGQNAHRRTVPAHGTAGRPRFGQNPRRLRMVRLSLGRYARPARAQSALPGPEQAKAAAVPGDDRPRLHEDECRPSAGGPDHDQFLRDASGSIEALPESLRGEDYKGWRQHLLERSLVTEAELPAIRIQRMGGETPERFRLQDHVEHEEIARNDREI